MPNHTLTSKRATAYCEWQPSCQACPLGPECDEKFNEATQNQNMSIWHKWRNEAVKIRVEGE